MFEGVKKGGSGKVFITLFFLQILESYTLPSSYLYDAHVHHYGDDEGNVGHAKGHQLKWEKIYKTPQLQHY